MIKRLLNPHILLKITLILTTLLQLLPSTALADETSEYGLYIANTPVSSDNATDVFSDGKVSFTPATDDNSNNILTLNGATINGSIVYSGDKSLTIKIKGTNNISSSDYAIYMPDGTDMIQELFFTRDFNAIDCELNLTSTTSDSPKSVIYNFKDIEFIDGLLDISSPQEATYDSENRLLKNGSGTAVTSTTISLAFPLWINRRHVTSINAGNINGDEKVSFDKESFKLTLNNATIKGNSTNPPIESGLENLSIEIIGENSITAGVSSVIFSKNRNGTLTILDNSDHTTASLFLETNCADSSVISGFGQANLQVLNIYNTNEVESPISEMSGVEYDTENRLMKANGNVVKRVMFSNQGIPYGITIADTEITSLNCANVFNNNTVSYDPETSTLNLNGATLGTESDSPVILFGENKKYIINILGSNTLRGFISGEEGNIEIHKGDDSPSLEIIGNCDMMGPIYGLSTVTLGNGLYFDYYTYEYEKHEYISIPETYYTNMMFTHPSSKSVDRIIISTNKPTISNPTIWIGSIEVSDGTSDDYSGVSFNKDNNTLTLNQASIGSDIISSLPNLTILLKDELSSVSKIISTNPDATLTFSSENNGSLTPSITNGDIPWQGFAGDPTFENKLVYLPNDDCQFIKVLEAPSIYYNNSNGQLVFGGLNDGYGTNFDCHYTITYGEGDPEQGSGSGPTLSVEKSLKPSTITAYVEFTDIFNKTTQSDITTAKFFGFGTEELVVPYQASVNAPAVFPALPSGVTKTFSGNELNPIDPETGVITINELTQGNPFVYQATFSAPTNNVGYTILNKPNYASGNSDIQIVESYDLGTFSVSVTKKDLKDVTIENIPNQTYAGTALTPDIKVKDGETYLTLGTDYEVSYKQGETVVTSLTNAGSYTVVMTGKGYYTGTATKTFTITAKSLNGANVTLADNKSEFTYNEAANVPTITQVSLTEETGATLQLTAGTDYTISYVKVNGETEEAIEVDKIINAGSYKMILTGKGNFSGTRAVEFTIIPRAITNLSFALSATSFTYNGEAQKPTVTVQFEETELEATKGTTKTIPTTDYDLTFSGECINAGTYSVSASLKGNYSGSGDGPSFTINKATISPKVTLAGWTYGATANTPSVSGNTGNGEVTYAYKLQNEAESAFAAEVPTNAGAYTVKASIAATANYEAASDTAYFTIAKDDITPTVTLEGWTYGSTPNKPEVKGNTGNGAETFTYKAEGAETFTSEVPSEVGTHTVKVTIAETTNYNGGEATATFTIINRTFNAASDITFAKGQTYASFYSSDEDLILPESGIAVYMIIGIEGNTLTTQAVSYIPKATPVLIEKTETAVEAKDPSEVGTNMLQYATEDVTTDGTLYILYNGEYVKATGTIPQGKCYLKPIKPSGSRRLTIGHNNGTTSISSFDAETGTDRWYDLNGQRVSKPQKKGVYINNGKKIVVK